MPTADQFGAELTPPELWDMIHGLQTRPPVANDLPELRKLRLQHADLLVALADRIVAAKADSELKTKARRARLEALAQAAQYGPPERVQRFLAAADAAMADADTPELAATAAALRVVVAGQRMRRPGPDEMEWLKRYALFAQQYAQGHFEGQLGNARSALVSAAHVAEGKGQPELAIACWKTWETAYPDDQLSALIPGTVRRLNALNKTYELRGPLFPEGEFNLASLRGRWVLLHVWRSSNPGCQQRLQNLAALRDRYSPAGLALVGICVDHQDQQLKRWVQEGWLNWPQLFAPSEPDQPSAAQREIGVAPPPFALLVDPDGKLVSNNLPFDNLEAVLKQVLEFKQ